MVIATTHETASAPCIFSILWVAYWLVLSHGSSLKCPSQIPGCEFRLADTLRLALGLLTGGDGDEQIQQFIRRLGHIRAVEDFSGIEIHIIRHMLIRRRIAADLDA